MKVLAAIVIPPHLTASGAVNAAKALSKALGEHCEMDVAIMAGEDGEESLGKARLLKRKASNILGFTRSFLPNKVRTLLYRSDIPQLVAEGGYDLVHIHNPVPALEMKRIAEACVRQGIPYVVSTHGFVEVTSGGAAYGLTKFYEKAAWNLLIERPLKYVVDHATMIFALSPLERPMLHELGVKDDRISVVTNGVNPNYYTEFAEDVVAQTAADLGLDPMGPEKRPTMAFLGNHTANKGLNVLLEAFPKLDVPCQLIVCGKKRPTIDYDSYVHQCGEGQNLVVTDFISDEAVQALFQYADIFVYPTLSDTLPLVVLEAMASKLAIVATKVGGIPYQITDDCGLLVQPGNSELLADACRSLIGDPGRVQAMGTAAHERVRKMFDWDVAAEAAMANYQRIATRESSSSKVDSKAMAESVQTADPRPVS